MSVIGWSPGMRITTKPFWTHAFGSLTYGAFGSPPMKEPGSTHQRVRVIGRRHRRIDVPRRKRRRRHAVALQDEAVLLRRVPLDVGVGVRRAVHRVENAEADLRIVRRPVPIVDAHENRSASATAPATELIAEARHRAADDRAEQHLAVHVVDAVRPVGLDARILRRNARLRAGSCRS